MSYFKQTSNFIILYIIHILIFLNDVILFQKIMIFSAIFEPISKATLLLIVGNSQNCFHDHELD